jgi:ribosomal protein S4
VGSECQIRSTREGQRIDRWLWHARLARTRGAAAALVDSGYVRVNGQRVRAASRAVRIGDVITACSKCKDLSSGGVRPSPAQPYMRSWRSRVVGPSARLNLRANKPCDRSMARKTRSRVSG